MSKAIDLSHIYSLRNNFTVIGLTGQIGSGCSEVANQLVKGFNNGLDFEDPFDIGFEDSKESFKHNSYRKYRIIYNYAKINFKNYSLINYKDILVVFLLEKSFEDFTNFLRSSDLKEELGTLGITSDFNEEIIKLAALKSKFDKLSIEYRVLDVKNINTNGNWKKLYEFYFRSEFALFCTNLHAILKNGSLVKRNKLLQIISTNLRKTGNPYKSSDVSANNIFTIVELINDIIKSHRKSEERTQVVIDDLRNPIEIMFFKQRFAAFYTIAVNRDDISRKQALSMKYKTPDTREIREPFWKEEYEGGRDDEFYKANISACIQQADIHITFLTEDEAAKKNNIVKKHDPEKEAPESATLLKEELSQKDISLKKQDQEGEKIESATTDYTSPYFSWKMQLLKYASLICQPGLVTPSPEERCMQMAYTAKHNSGCISRHVGAAITDGNYSIKAIGWNNTPAGQVPCVLRNVDDILYLKKDVKAFTNYEKENTDFRDALFDNFESPVQQQTGNLKGRNACFCFKDIKNSYSEGKNQVHTRSLHAEESAFLQISKYGGNGIQNGKLFTTASPCELCAKKAYQLGIKVIYYIDPYPGISLSHILSSGNNPIEIRLFNGAIGNAYHWLYDPIMPYKNEMTLLLGNKFKDYASKQKDTANKYKEEIIEKDKRIQELEAKLKKFEN